MHHGDFNAGRQRWLSWRRTLVLVAILFAAFSMGTSRQLASEPGPADTNGGQSQTRGDDIAVKRARDLWRDLVAIEPAGDVRIEEPVDYWAAVARGALEEFYSFIKESPPRAAFEEFVRQFGKHGPAADLRWLLAARSVGCKPDFGYAPYSASEYPKVRRAQLLMAELEVRAFLKDRCLLRRYYHAVLWYGDFFDPLFFPVHVGTTARKLKDADENEYWWYARAFVLFAHATGRDDLLRGVEPEGLRPQADKWYKWFQQEGMYLRSSTTEPTWVLDEGERERQEAYFPFISKPFALPPLDVAPKHPLPDWDLPSPGTSEDLGKFSLLSPEPWADGWRRTAHAKDSSGSADGMWLCPWTVELTDDSWTIES